MYSFFLLKNVLFAQSDKCCELRKTKCQPMRSEVMWWCQISDSISQNIPSQTFPLNAVIPIQMHLFIFFYWKNVLFAQSNKCCELCKTKCQPMRRVMWWHRISDSISQNIPSQIFFVIQSDGRPWWLSWILIRRETRRSRVQPPPRLATFFRGDWWWNIFYGHSLPSADSRRVDVSFWRKNVHNTG